MSSPSAAPRGPVVSLIKHPSLWSTVVKQRPRGVNGGASLGRGGGVQTVRQAKELGGSLSRAAEKDGKLLWMMQDCREEEEDEKEEEEEDKEEKEEEEEREKGKEEEEAVEGGREKEEESLCRHSKERIKSIQK
ncbi:hypothetical protein PoB_001466000 [Plakobranchus ocellatus]|uniref:Uncharacterized protein n=1 Tax=Plakobranchus ocellatus TaxID=259542 RepID=A0AAV3YZ24_9GAST|nr:hypothetical protein PoB_001466000 [Plakobranchus ocellatus]